MAQHSYPDGSLLKGTGDRVYVIEDGKRKWIPSREAFAAGGYDWANVQSIPDSTLNIIPLADGSLIKGDGDRVYVIVNGQKQWIPNPEAFAAEGFLWPDIEHVSDGVLAIYETGSNFTGEDISQPFDTGDQSIFPADTMNAILNFIQAPFSIANQQNQTQNQLAGFGSQAIANLKGTQAQSNASLQQTQIAANAQLQALQANLEATMQHYTFTGQIDVERFNATLQQATDIQNQQTEMRLAEGFASHGFRDSLTSRLYTRGLGGQALAGSSFLDGPPQPLTAPQISLPDPGAAPTVAPLDPFTPVEIDTSGFADPNPTQVTAADIIAQINANPPLAEIPGVPGGDEAIVPAVNPDGTQSAQLPTPVPEPIIHDFLDENGFPIPIADRPPSSAPPAVVGSGGSTGSSPLAAILAQFNLSGVMPTPAEMKAYEDAYPNLPALAHGGRVHPTRRGPDAIVGEAGPELLDLRPDGSVDVIPLRNQGPGGIPALAHGGQVRQRTGGALSTFRQPRRQLPLPIGIPGLAHGGTIHNDTNTGGTTQSDFSKAGLSSLLSQYNITGAPIPDQNTLKSEFNDAGLTSLLSQQNVSPSGSIGILPGETPGPGDIEPTPDIDPGAGAGGGAAITEPPPVFPTPDFANAPGGFSFDPTNQTGTDLLNEPAIRALLGNKLNLPVQSFNLEEHGLFGLPGPADAAHLFRPGVLSQQERNTLMQTFQLAGFPPEMVQLMLQTFTVGSNAFNSGGSGGFQGGGGVLGF